MRLCVSGGRTYDRWQIVHPLLSKFHARYGVEALISGRARGLDFTAETWAMNNGIPIEGYPADWDTHGRRAGIIRNCQMLDASPHLVITFPGGKGTKHMREAAIARKIPTLIVPDREWEAMQPVEDIGHEIIVVFDGEKSEPPTKPYWGWKPTSKQLLEPLNARELLRQRAVESAKRYEAEALF